MLVVVYFCMVFVNDWLEAFVCKFFFYMCSPKLRLCVLLHAAVGGKGEKVRGQSV